MGRRRDFDFDFDTGAWFGGPWGKGKKRGHFRAAWFGHGDMKYVILKLLKERPMHGYEVMKELEERTRGCYKPSPGTVYPTLQWLEDEGLVELEVVDGKKVFSITPAGLGFLEENKSTVEDIFERVGDMIDRIFSDPGPDISRAVGRLVGLAYRTAWKGDRSPEHKAAVLEVLERATAELEKLGGDGK